MILPAQNLRKANRMDQMVVFATYYYDMRYTLESAVVLAFVVWATWIYWAGRQSEPGLQIVPPSAGAIGGAS